LPRQPMMVTSIEMLGGGVLLLLTGLLFGEGSRLQLRSVSPLSFLSLLYLIFFGSIIAFSCYMWLLRNTTPTRLATYAYVNPVVAMLLGWAFAHEALTLRMLLASVVILFAVALLSISPPRAGEVSHEGS